MRHSFLVVNQHPHAADLFTAVAQDFDLIFVGSGQDGMIALDQLTPWCGIIAAANLPDMQGIDFLTQASAKSGGIPLLLATDHDLARSVRLANNHSLFRVVPESTPPEDMHQIFQDTVQHFERIHQEQRLQARISQLTIIDPLTGCYNRSHLEEHLQKELRRSIRYAHPLSIIVCDIDGLQRINESISHRAGDAILTAFARTAAGLIRQEIDTITRWGEDEFLLLLPETPIRGAGRVANRLRDHLEQLRLEQDGHLLTCTASFGVAGYTPDAGSRNTCLEELLLIAGRCLLQAKAAGGNQVLCCP
jgi:diguanylate cyclase (GGDEF)-like protein